MIIKDVNYDLAIQEWSHLLDSGALQNDQELIAKIYLAGVKAEKNMAYYLGVRFSDHQDLIVFNNLKIEHNGYTAQIDHLVLSRWSAYFIETKNVSHKLHINADGQWARVYGRKHKPFESPIEQSRRHESTLFNMLESRLPEFMGKILGFQKTFRKQIDVHHWVAIPYKATITGPGKKAIAEHLKYSDPIPQLIEDNHKKVKSSFVGAAIADLQSSDHEKRFAAFTKEEFKACCQIIIDSDISQTPLEQAHAFIDTLPAEAADIENTPDSDNNADALKQPQSTVDNHCEASTAKPTPRCPKCDKPMVLRTALRGANAGKQFYGCSSYPQCKGIINVD